MAVRGAVGVTTDDASSTRQYVGGKWDYEQERASSGSVQVQHHLGKVHGIGLPSTLGWRLGMTRRSDLGVEFGWGHAGANTRVDLLAPESAAHLVLTIDTRLTVHLNPSAASRLVAYLPIVGGPWKLSALLGAGASGGAFGYTTWHQSYGVPIPERVDRRELRAEGVLGFSLHDARDASKTGETLLFLLPYWVVAKGNLDSTASYFEFAHNRGALLALSGTFGAAMR